MDPKRPDVRIDENPDEKGRVTRRNGTSDENGDERGGVVRSVLERIESILDR